MNKEKIIYNTIKTKAYGVNRTTRPAYGQGQYDMAYEILNMVEEIINTEPKNNGWIPVYEKLPNTDGMYKVIIFDSWTKRTFETEVKFGIVFIVADGNYVVAWQPLPQPYKGE